jgi:hypothetical protein
VRSSLYANTQLRAHRRAENKNKEQNKYRNGYALMLAMTTYRYSLLIVHVFNRRSTLNDRSAVALP